MEEEEEESDERDGFSVGGVSCRVGSTRDGIVGGVITRLPARDRAGLENGEECAVLDAREPVAAVVSVEALGRRAKGKVEVEEGREVVELVDGLRIRKEESRVETVLGGLALLGEEGGVGDRGGKCADEVERRPSVDGRRIVSGSAFDSTYWVIARGAGDIRRLRGQFDRRKCGSSI